MKKFCALLVLFVLLVSSVGCNSGNGLTHEQLIEANQKQTEAIVNALQPLVESTSAIKLSLDAQAQQRLQQAGPRVYMPGNLTSQTHYFMGQDGKYHEEVLDVPAPQTVPAPVPVPVPAPAPAVSPTAFYPVGYCCPQTYCYDDCGCGVPWGPWVPSGRGGRQSRVSNCGQTQVRYTSHAH